ncbi:LamG domain-containing protein [Rubritalea tangerina]|uniref:LamG domain-containing protein n=1 Tax=Rubritalea tangerina TaxID=430798 RepID=A0ABW4ZB30_9BACT
MNIRKKHAIAGMVAALGMSAGNVSAALVAHYTFDNAGNLGENSGSAGLTWNGSSGATAVSGKFGGAAGFVPATDYWNSGFGTAAVDFSNFTVSMHVKAPSAGNWTDFISFNGGGGTLKIEQNSGGHASVYSTNTPGGAAVTIGGGAGPDIRDGGWHQLGLVSSGGTLTLYIDGIAVESAAYAGSGTITGLQLGAEWALGRRTTADIDDVAIYDRALTAGEMAWLNVNVATEAVPEPSSAILIGLGGLGLVLRRKR